MSSQTKKFSMTAVLIYDPKLFPLQNMGSNVIQYDRILKFKPDYIVLTDWKNNWVAEKIRCQHLDQCNPDPYSVRLYQDLIPQDPQTWKAGPTSIPYIELVHFIPAASDKFIIYNYFFKKEKVNLNPWLFRSALIFKIHPKFYHEWNKKCHLNNKLS